MQEPVQTIANRETVYGLIQCAHAARVPVSKQLLELAHLHGIDLEEVAHSRPAEVYEGPEPIAKEIKQDWVPRPPRSVLPAAPKSSTVETLAIEGTCKVGEILTLDKPYRVIEILGEFFKYELDGIIYEDYPPIDPDREWLETHVRAEPLSETHTAAIETANQLTVYEIEVERKATVKVKISARSPQEAIALYQQGKGKAEIISETDLTDPKAVPVTSFP